MSCSLPPAAPLLSLFLPSLVVTRRFCKLNHGDVLINSAGLVRFVLDWFVFVFALVSLLLLLFFSRRQVVVVVVVFVAVAVAAAADSTLRKEKKERRRYLGNKRRREARGWSKGMREENREFGL